MTETTATIPENTAMQQASTKKGVGNLFQTKWINNNLWFFLYLALLTVCYIAYGHWTDKTLRKIAKTKKDIEVYEYKYRSAIIEASKSNQQSEIIEKTKSLNLITTNSSPIVIKK